MDASFTCFSRYCQTVQELKRWRHHPALLKYDPNYDIDMGFGLHIGWSIEGAIGSNHKVDASYLSPNVNMSARLEGATKQFGVKLLFSGVFYGLMQPKVQKLCRMLDRITVKGSLVPIDIYTFDMPKTATLLGITSFALDMLSFLILSSL